MVLFDILFGDGTDEMARERFNRERAEYEKRENEREEYYKERREAVGEEYWRYKAYYDDLFRKEYDEYYCQEEEEERDRSNSCTKEMYVALKPPKGKEAVISWSLMGGPGMVHFDLNNATMDESTKRLKDMADNFTRYPTKFEKIVRHSEMVQRMIVTDSESGEVVTIKDQIMKTIPERRKIIYWVTDALGAGERFDSMRTFDINKKERLPVDRKIRKGDRVYWIDEVRWRDDTSGQPGVKRVTKWQ